MSLLEPSVWVPNCYKTNIFYIFLLNNILWPRENEKISYLMSKIAEINWHCVLKVSFHEKNGIFKKCNQVIQSLSPSGHQFRFVWGWKLHKVVVVAGFSVPSEKWVGGPRGGHSFLFTTHNWYLWALQGRTIPTETHRFGLRFLSKLVLCPLMFENVSFMRNRSHFFFNNFGKPLLSVLPN